jgi:hypothetical protein
VLVVITKTTDISTLLHFRSLHFRVYVRSSPTIASSLSLEMANAAQLKKEKEEEMSSNLTTRFKNLHGDM